MKDPKIVMYVIAGSSRRARLAGKNFSLPAAPVQSQISAGTVTPRCASVLAYRPTRNPQPKFQVVLPLLLSLHCL